MHKQMTDPRKFKAPFNPKERIWQEADRPGQNSS